jgi:hypothetical protein
VSKDVRHDAGEIAGHFEGGDAQGRDPEVCQVAIALPVVLVTEVVAAVVHLDAEVGRRAVEVEDIGTGRVASAKADAESVAAKCRPEQALGHAHALAKVGCADAGRGIALDVHHQPPARRSGRGDGSGVGPLSHLR